MIKVADFGLAESMDSSKEYFRQNEEAIVKLPVKWLAPECISDRIFSEKTDVVGMLHRLLTYTSSLGFHSYIIFYSGLMA